MVQGQSWERQLDMKHIPIRTLTGDGQCSSLSDRIRAGASSESGWGGADSDISGDSNSGPNWRGHGIVAGWGST
jgi:hypothetical protein